MKNIFRKWFIVANLFIIVAFAGCNNDEPKPEPEDPAEENVSFELTEGNYSYKYLNEYTYSVRYVPVDNNHANLVFEGKRNDNIVLSPMTYGKPLTLPVNIIKDVEKDKVYVYCQDEVIDNIAYSCCGVFSSVEEWLIDDIYTKNIKLDLQMSQHLIKSLSLGNKIFDKNILNGNYFIQSDDMIEFNDKRKQIVEVLYDMFSVPVASYYLYEYYMVEDYPEDSNVLTILGRIKKLNETTTISLAQYLEGNFGYFDFSDDGYLRIFKNCASAVYNNNIYLANSGTSEYQYAVNGDNSVRLYFTTQSFKMGMPCVESDNWFKKISNKCYEAYANESIRNLFIAWKNVYTENGTSGINFEIEQCNNADFEACVVYVDSHLSKQFFTDGVIPFFSDNIRHLPLNKSVKMNLINGMQKLGYSEDDVEQILQVLPGVIENSSNFRIGVKAGYKKSESSPIVFPERLVQLIDAKK